MTTFLRGDGGKGGFGEAPAPLEPVPTREAEFAAQSRTSPQSGLLYRLEGDLNPVHADPATAAQAGYPAPILHGLCTLGASVHSLLGWACGDENDAVAQITVRFTAPVYPGETLHTEAWREGRTRQFRTRVRERGIVVLDRGLIVLR